MIYLFSKFIVRGRRSFVKKRRKKREREKEKSMISMPRSSLLSSKERRRYLKTSTAKFFMNFSVGGSLSRSKVELG
jgi:hypothetical protein